MKSSLFAMAFSLAVLCLAGASVAFAQAESQLTLVKQGQRANGIALEYGRTAGNTEYLKELSPDCYAVIDVPVTIYQGYQTVFGTGNVQQADLVRGGATILIPGFSVTENISIPVFAQLTSSYTTVDTASSDNVKQGTELSDFLIGSGVQYRDLGILHVGLVQSKETVYANDLKTSENESGYKPFVSVLVPFLDIAVSSLNGIDYLNLQVSRLGRYAKIPAHQNGYTQTNNVSFGFTRLGPADQNNFFVRVSEAFGYVDAGLEYDPVSNELRALTAGVSYLWEWTRMFLELRVDGSMYKDQRITERMQMIQSVSADKAAELTDPIMGGRAGVHFGLKRDYLYGPRDLSWYDRFVPSRGVFEMSYNDKEILQAFYEAYNHPTVFGQVIWDIEPANPPHYTPAQDASPAAQPPAPQAAPPAPPPQPQDSTPPAPTPLNPSAPLNPYIQ